MTEKNFRKDLEILLEKYREEVLEANLVVEELLTFGVCIALKFAPSDMKAIAFVQDHIDDIIRAHIKSKGGKIT